MRPGNRTDWRQQFSLRQHAPERRLTSHLLPPTISIEWPVNNRLPLYSYRKASMGSSCEALRAG